MNDVNDVRRLRAAVEKTRVYQRLASGGTIVAALCLYYSGNDAFQGTALPLVLRVAAPIILIGSLVPFLLSKCPKCKGRFHSFASVFRSADDPAPCVACGFNLNKHIPRYGSLSDDA
jgi:hypothetical protein